MKVALDVDATLTDMNGFLAEHAERYFTRKNRTVRNREATTAELMFDITSREARPFWKRYYIHYCLSVRLKPHIREALNGLKQDGHELHVVTARIGTHRRDLLGFLLRRAVIGKFKRHGIDMDSYTFTNDAIPDDKVKACRAGGYDTIVEDNPGHIERIARELNIPVIVMNTPENAELELDNLVRIDSLSELSEAVKRVEKINLARGDE